MLTKIPMLDSDISAGTGKLGRHLNLRLTSGTEVGRRLADVTFEHLIETEEDAEQLESYLPGALEAYRASREPEESRKRGKRPYSWTPEQGNVKLIVSPAGGGRKVYEGAAEVKRATVRCLPKACVLTVYLRLHEVECEDENQTLVRLAEELGNAVDYELTATRIEGTAGKPADGDATLPFTATAASVPVQSGDLVVAAMGEDLDTEVIGCVAVVHAGGAVVHQRFDRSDDPLEIPLDKILTVMQLTGPMGGVFEPGKMPDDVEAADLLQAITEGTEQGTLVRGPHGFPIGRAIVERAAAFAAQRIPEAV